MTSIMMLSSYDDMDFSYNLVTVVDLLTDASEKSIFEFVLDFKMLFICLSLGSLRESVFKYLASLQKIVSSGDPPHTILFF
jgi:hypothetical protein